MEAGETALRRQQLTMDTTHTMKLALNKEWVLGARIGGGGFGAVFAAENAAGEQAAVKLVHKEPGTDRYMLFTNLDGARNVVPIIDSGEHEDQLGAGDAPRGQVPARPSPGARTPVSERGRLRTVRRRRDAWPTSTTGESSTAT